MTNKTQLSQNKKLNSLFKIDHEAKELVAFSVTEYLRKHFLKLNEERHRGLYAKGFYAQAADGITSEVKDKSVDFSINKVGLAQRLYGGTIKPKTAKLLAIPNWEEFPKTATKGPTEFDNLFFFKSKKTGAMGLAMAKKGKKAKLSVFYWLVKKVVQKPDPSVMPKMSEISNVAYNAVLKRAKELGV